MMALLILSVFVCIVALLSTIYLGMNQKDETYEKTTKKRIILLSSFYFIAFVPALIFTVLYVFF